MKAKILVLLLFHFAIASQVIPAALGGGADKAVRGLGKITHGSPVPTPEVRIPEPPVGPISEGELDALKAQGLVSDIRQAGPGAAEEIENSRRGSLVTIGGIGGVGGAVFWCDNGWCTRK